MTRVRFDPGFIGDPRWERLGADAYVMHAAACSYVVAHLTDGVITRAAAMRLPLVRAPKKMLAALVDDGMWTDRGDDSFDVCACLDDLRTAAGRGDEQPTRAFVEKERDRKDRNKRAWVERQNTDAKPVRNPVPNRGKNRVQHSTAQSSTAQSSSDDLRSSSLLSGREPKTCGHESDRWRGDQCAECWADSRGKAAS